MTSVNFYWNVTHKIFPYSLYRSQLCQTDIYLWSPFCRCYKKGTHLWSREKERFRRAKEETGEQSVEREKGRERESDKTTHCVVTPALHNKSPLSWSSSWSLLIVKVIINTMMTTTTWLHAFSYSGRVFILVSLLFMDIFYLWESQGKLNPLQF